MTQRMGGQVSTPIEAMRLCDLNNACSVSSVLTCADVEHSYRGSVSMNFHGETIVTRTRQIALRYQRQPHHISQDPSDSVFIHMNRGVEPFRGKQMGREWTLNPGAASLYVHNEPVTLESRHGGDFLGIALPRSLTLDWAEEPEDLIGRAFDTRAPEFAMLVPYLEFLSEGNLDDTGVTQIALRHASDLARFWIGGQRDTDMSAQTYVGQQLRLIIAQMKRRITDPDLSVQDIARSLKVSVRTIQHVLTRNDTSFSRLLGKLRSEAVARMLRDPARSGMSITTIAFECGFSDLSAFYRHFKNRFGVMPSDLRAHRHEVLSEGPSS